MITRMTVPLLAVILGIMPNLADSTGSNPQPPQPKGRVLGIGGVFFKSPHPKELTGWYERHLGFKGDPRIGVTFPWKLTDDPDQAFRTIWALFPQDTRYFEPSKSELMLNYIVDDLDAILARLQSEGVKIDPRRETGEAGRFAWIYDADGNKVELWEPATQTNSF